MAKKTSRAKRNRGSPARSGPEAGPPAAAGVLGRLLQHAVDVQAKAVDRLVRPEGVTRIQLAVLQSVPNTGVSMSGIAERLRCHVSNLTGVIDRMQSQGLVKRQRVREDRRSIRIRLTPEGEGVRRRLGPAAGDLHDSLAGGLSERETEKLQVLLQKYIAGAEQQLEASGH